jgi:hypothetical protein
LHGVGTISMGGRSNVGEGAATPQGIVLKR